MTKRKIHADKVKHSKGTRPNLLLKPDKGAIAERPASYVLFGLYADITGGFEQINAAQEVLSGHGLKAVQATGAIALAQVEVSRAVSYPKDPTREPYNTQYLTDRIQEELSERYTTRNKPTTGLRLGMLQLLERPNTQYTRPPAVTAMQLYDPARKGAPSEGIGYMRRVALDAVESIAIRNYARGHSRPSVVTQPLIVVAEAPESTAQFAQLYKDIRAATEGLPLIEVGPVHLETSRSFETYQPVGQASAVNRPAQ